MRTWTDRYEQASRRVSNGRVIVDRQRALIEWQRTLGRDTQEYERLLESFERSQEIFESDLARICDERRNRTDDDRVVPRGDVGSRRNGLEGVSRFRARVRRSRQQNCFKS
jgi:hypothetical protein